MQICCLGLLCQASNLRTTRHCHIISFPARMSHGMSAIGLSLPQTDELLEQLLWPMHHRLDFFLGRDMDGVAQEQRSTRRLTRRESLISPTCDLHEQYWGRLGHCEKSTSLRESLEKTTQRVLLHRNSVSRDTVGDKDTSGLALNI